MIYSFLGSMRGANWSLVPQSVHTLFCKINRFYPAFSLSLAFSKYLTPFFFSSSFLYWISICWSIYILIHIHYAPINIYKEKIGTIYFKRKLDTTHLLLALSA